jgi:exonuclease SbcC
MAVLEKELEELDRKRQDFELRQKAFEPDSHRLERSLLAMSLEGDFRGIAALRELQTQEMEELHDAVATLPEKEKTATEGLFAREKAEFLLNETRTRQHSEGEVLKKVRDLDSRLGEQEKQLVEKDRAIAEIESQEKEYGNLLEQGKQKWKEVHAALEAIYAYRKKLPRMRP